MTFDIGVHEVCVRVDGRAGVRYIITKFSRMDSLPNFLTHGAPLRALRARESSAINQYSASVDIIQCTEVYPFAFIRIFFLKMGCGLEKTLSGSLLFYSPQQNII